MSVAVNLTMKLVEQAARALKSVTGGADVEIIERHHRFKEDSPSGTALKFGQIVAKEMTTDKHVHGRKGYAESVRTTKSDTTPFALATMLANTRLSFGMMGETIELRVAVSNRDCYASEALSLQQNG